MSESSGRTARPRHGARCAFDQLACDPDAIAGPSDAAFENVANAQLAADLSHVNCATLVGEAGLRAMTNNPPTRERAVMISSTIPSAKYSCSGSPLMFVNGRTATDGLSGSGSDLLPHFVPAPGGAKA